MEPHGLESVEPAGFPQLPASGEPHQRASIAAGFKCFCIACDATGERDGEPCLVCLSRGTFLRFIGPAWPRVSRGSEEAA